MATNPRDKEKIEAYTRALMEAAKSEDRANSDLVQWKHAVKFSPEVLETLTAMRQDDDLDLVGQVADQYQALLDEGDDTLSVTVTTAVPMDDGLRDKVRATVGARTNRPVYLVERVDPGIVGGLVIEMQGKRYDASVRAQLANIRERLSSSFIGSEE